ncbi:hypothetical protein ACIOJD_27570 [Streptomyces sp. NPDC088116]|uniref:hypothetical protein n=1 Tax=Streptomyces sp. NPDC088116 TaxID=3365825 RepID=UPI003820C95E
MQKLALMLACRAGPNWWTYSRFGQVAPRCCAIEALPEPTAHTPRVLGVDEFALC